MSRGVDVVVVVVYVLGIQDTLRKSVVSSIDEMISLVWPCKYRVVYMSWKLSFYVT